MEILELKKLKEIIKDIEKNSGYFHGDREVIQLYNSFLKLYNNLDITFDMFEYNISLIPEDKVEYYQGYVQTIIDSIAWDYYIMDKLGISKEILEDCKKIVQKKN